MSTSIRIDKAELSKSGKSYKILGGGKTYYAKPDQGVHELVGKTIDAEVKMSEYNGSEMWWINAYTKVRQDAAPAGATPTVYSANPIAPMWLPFASNVVAHAIQSGYVDDPTKIRAWVFAVKGAVESASNPDADLQF
jgi:hypothetical protein